MKKPGGNSIKNNSTAPRLVAATPLKWTWPATGGVKTAASPLIGNRGLEIRGKRGDPVRAAADGQVVYSGSGLRGYGQLIIIKHNDIFLSAYAHNEKLLAAEGANVKAGQEIAEMGDSETKDVMLHFEIRRDGKAVEPLKYLPQR
jgi:lipoprotein NlpD